MPKPAQNDVGRDHTRPGSTSQAYRRDARRARPPSAVRGRNHGHDPIALSPYRRDKHRAILPLPGDSGQRSHPAGRMPLPTGDEFPPSIASTCS